MFLQLLWSNPKRKFLIRKWPVRHVRQWATIVIDSDLSNFHWIVATAMATRRSLRTKKPNKFLLHHREMLRTYYNDHKMRKTNKKMIGTTKTVHFSPKIQYFYFKSEKKARYELRVPKKIRVWFMKSPKETTLLFAINFLHIICISFIIYSLHYFFECFNSYINYK